MILIWLALGVFVCGFVVVVFGWFVMCLVVYVVLIWVELFTVVFVFSFDLSFCGLRSRFWV